ncbi:formate dehydrogenase subunit gamma [Rhodovibrio salinarum]|uniref:Formate dehydrogenase subunit gamma n=1 Tax=Rhodovibrio salinarum TaxID=1087 RepID=A0A934V0K5_9PROT|nr:formate dehydrogenase subunit gamma [Rhodovibrio salinarum]MBK1698337.1 formate dehydrogenase subunit gamma [Rhodovibrio salinarum]
MSSQRTQSVARRQDAGGWLFPLLATLIVAVFLTLAASSPAWAQSGTADPSVTAEQPTRGQIPGNALGGTNDTEFWKMIRQGQSGTVSQPDKKLGVLVDSSGENWRAILNGPVKVYGAWLILGVLALLALFYALRGRVPVDGGFSGKTVERFTTLDRFAHWLSATSFVILAFTGLNLVYGKYFLLPLIGPSAFSWITQAGKYAHNFVAFAFMAGVIMMFLLWVRFNIPKKHDLTWLAKGGGIFDSKVHAPSERFNAGQKGVFWLACLGGLSLSMSGIALLFPFEFGFFGKTFAALNGLGLDLPAQLSPLQEQQLNQIWHSILAFVLIAVMLAHVYIGSVGMQGAFSAMGSGQVDVNWAEEHHNMWYARLVEEGRAPPSNQIHPAE